MKPNMNNALPVSLCIALLIQPDLEYETIEKLGTSNISLWDNQAGCRILCESSVKHI